MDAFSSGAQAFEAEHFLDLIKVAIVAHYFLLV